MYRYKCRDCGYEFDEPWVYYEGHEKWSVCPFCGEDAWDDILTVNKELAQEEVDDE